MTAKELLKALSELDVEYYVKYRTDGDSPNLMGIRFWVEEENEEKDLTSS